MDVIADLLTRIRNAQLAKKRYADVPLSKAKKRIVEIFKEFGFVEHFLVSEEKKKIRVFLKYNRARKPVINKIQRISRPGRREYIGSSDIPSIRKGLGLAVVSTSQGMLDGESARSKNLGGELICSIW